MVPDYEGAQQESGEGHEPVLEVRLRVHGRRAVLGGRGRGGRRPDEAGRGEVRGQEAEEARARGYGRVGGESGENDRSAGKQNRRKHSLFDWQWLERVLLFLKLRISQHVTERE